MAQTDCRLEEAGAVALPGHGRSDEIAAHARSPSWQSRGSDPAADGDRVALRIDQRRSDHYDRRGPAPDVGGPMVQIQIPAAVAHERWVGRDGLWFPGGPRREGRLPGQAGDRYRR